MHGVWGHRPVHNVIACLGARGDSRIYGVAFDEMNGLGGDLRPAYQELSRWLKETPPDALEYRRQEAELLFRRIGITFAVYGDAEAQERLIPFDVIPRIMSGRNGPCSKAVSGNGFVRSICSCATSITAAISCAPTSSPKI